MQLARGLQLGGPSVGFFSMVAKLTDFLHGFVEILVQGTGQLHLIRQTSHAVTTILHRLGSGSSGTGNAPFSHLPRGIVQPRFHV
jgi:hypothetical protein